MAVSLFADTNTGEAFPSVPTIARVAALGVRTVQYALRRLEAKGWVSKRRESGGGVTHLFVLMIPDGATVAPSDGARRARDGALDDASMVQTSTANGAGAAGELGRTSQGTSGRRRTALGEADAREEGGDGRFGELIAGVGLGTRGRRELHDAWRAEPARVEACVAEWRRRKSANRDVGSGLLVVMVRDGDDPTANGRRPMTGVEREGRAADFVAEQGAHYAPADLVEELMARFKLPEQLARELSTGGLPAA
jgi:hypothetical protein